MQFLLSARAAVSLISRLNLPRAHTQTTTRGRKAAQRQQLCLLLISCALVCLWANQLPTTSAIATINIWKHRYPFYGGYGGYYPFWGGYGGFGGGYGGISLGGFGGGGYGR